VITSEGLGLAPVDVSRELIQDQDQAQDIPRRALPILKLSSPRALKRLTKQLRDLRVYLRTAAKPQLGLLFSQIMLVL